MIAKNVYGLYSIPKEVEYTYTAQLILEGGVHEDTTIEYLKSVGGNIIHAGSGFGDFLPALKDCDSVWAFEPNTLMYESSLETISLNNISNVKLFPYALGRYDGTGNLKHIDEKGLEMGPRSEMDDDGIEVKMVKLDSMIPKDTKISLIHLDLEGYEFAALNGAKQIIERDKPIIVLEIDSRAVTYNDFMLSINYVPYKQLIFNSNERMVFVNTVYIHKDKEVKKYIVCFASKAIGSVFYISNNHDLGSHRVN
jgi:FkbM family methyltransferase